MKHMKNDQLSISKSGIIHPLEYLKDLYHQWRAIRDESATLNQLAKLPPHILKDIGLTSSEDYKSLYKKSDLSQGIGHRHDAVSESQLINAVHN